MLEYGAVTKLGKFAFVQCWKPLGLESLLVGVCGHAAKAQEEPCSGGARLCSPVFVMKEGCQKHRQEGRCFQRSVAWRGDEKLSFVLSQILL